MRVLLVLFVLMVSFSAARADPIVLDARAFSYPNGQFTILALASNPTLTGTVIFPSPEGSTFIVFEALISSAQAISLGVTFCYGSTVLQTYTYDTPGLDGGWLVFGQFFPASYTETPASLVLALAGITYTYNFSVVQPIPEPASWLLMVTALSGLVVMVRKKR